MTYKNMDNKTKQQKERIKALATFLEVSESKVCDWEGSDDFHLEVPLENEDHPQTYRVMTDEEAGQAWDEYLDDFIAEIISTLPEPYRCYFHADEWKEDARVDGRGNSLAAYDGVEEEQKIGGTTYYIYRQT